LPLPNRILRAELLLCYAVPAANRSAASHGIGYKPAGRTVNYGPAGSGQYMEIYLVSTAYLWIKALHVAFMVTWFAGLFYLPRLFIYHVQAEGIADRQRFSIMEVRLFAIMSIGAVVTAVFGSAMLYVNPGLLDQNWFLSKMFIVLAMIVYHLRCWRWIQRLKAADATQDARWLRWFNEIPVLFLLGVVCLAIVKPF
jgi:putative membrane protein